MLNFMGMDNRENYIATKKIKDKFMALDKHSVITTWNLLNGKLESQHKLDSDFSEYDIYSYESFDVAYKREWY
jgi:hypothetical protein